MSAIVYDTETTGIDPEKDRVIQHGYLYAGFDENGMFQAASVPEVEWFSSDVPISYGAMAVHKIAEEDIVGKERFYPDQLPPASYMIGHNVDFDWKMVGQPAYKRICTLAIARAVYPEADGHSLGAIYLMQQAGNKTALAQLAGAHDAGVDVAITFGVLWRMLLDYRPDIRTLEALWQWSEECRVPKRWGFGKFKGLPIEAADRGYMSWYLKQAETDPYVVQAIRAVMR